MTNYDSKSNLENFSILQHYNHPRRRSHRGGFFARGWKFALSKSALIFVLWIGFVAGLAGGVVGILATIEYGVAAVHEATSQALKEYTQKAEAELWERHKHKIQGAVQERKRRH